MRKIVATIALCAAVMQITGSAQAQDMSALMARSDTTMQDIENGALRNTMNRVSASLDASTGSGVQGNAFYGVQDGQYNRIDATQTGTGNLIRVMQSGNSNAAVIAQSGSFNQIIVRQGR
ncbi:MULTISPECIES: curlin repeat-containing protein [Methylobacteriaceae]|uniref:curlin repeat-containing protein n=1 Tax=Methylobacteriaceae TaxID=119045 RepID=UPI00074FA18D|nr:MULTISPECIES: curlin repeat-containing protein [Methylobacteriaceae]AMB43276.1 hypothetical protein Y590_00075 [Methylobacterium sp. AMS5]TFZ55825.1 hypothetical protein E4V01_21060 [Methylorubrum sp. Q1]